ncbi:MAG: anthranilate phosphoribosyltransferase [Candidatus Omnitrophica bacterium]|nr:anthranilate phosphoribosyltransferase [Candidatus Omnitrophota bacterium]MBU4479470.1 anthranilate phosphoribosyltransferase [Candidatus Omnitrophota bacterium]
MIKECIKKVVEGNNLSQQEMEAVFSEIMSGEATAAQIAAFITALRLKKESIEEITGAAQVMRRFATRINVNKDVILDTCGTGGDCKNTFNISTISAFIASGAGITVAKHGNRSVSSKCGSADLLERLGVNISATPEVIEACINKIGIGFLFAPSLHLAMKYAIGPRKEIGIRTIFNILGPLTNPAQATHQLLGVFDAALTEPIARVLGNLGSKHALVVHGLDGLDEVSTSADTVVSEFKNGTIKNHTVSPEEFGIKRAPLDELQVTDSQENVTITKKILSGEKGPLRNAVLLNAGFAIYAADAAPSIKAAIDKAKMSLDSGRAKEKLRLLIDYTNGIDS